MADEVKILEYRVNIEDAATKLASLTEQIDALKAANKELKKSEGDNSVEMAANAIQIAQLQKSVSNLKKEITDEIKTWKERSKILMSIENEDRKRSEMFEKRALKEEIQAQKEAEAAKNKQGYLNGLVESVNSLERAFYQLSEAEYKNAMNKQFGTAGHTLLETLKAQRTELSKAQAEYGKFSMNVGNYSSATKMLGINVGQVLKEIPNFAISARIGIMSLTNNLPLLAENIKAVKIEQQNMKKAFDAGLSSEKPASMVSLLSRSIFGLTGVMSLLMVLFQVFGEDIAKWITNMWEAVRGTDEYAESINRLNTRYSQANRLTEERIAIFNVYNEKRSEQINNEIEMERDKWNKNEGFELNNLRREKLYKENWTRAKRKRMEELEEIEKTYIKDMSKLESDFRVSQAKEEDDANKKAAEDKKKANKEAERAAREAFNKRYEEFRRLMELENQMLTSQADVIKSLEESFADNRYKNKRKEEERRHKLIVDSTQKSLGLIKASLKEEVDIDSASVDAMIEKRKNFYKAKVDEADLELANIQNLGQADLEAQFKLLDAKRDAEIFSAKAIGEDTTKITAYYESLKTKIKEDNANSQLSSISSMFGSLSQMMEEDSVAQKIAATAQATINTYLGATAAFAQTPGDIVTKSLASAAAIAAGLASVYEIWKVDTSVPNISSAESVSTTTKTEKFHTGGTIGGTGEVPITALGGESVLTTKATSMFSPILSSLNMMGGGKAITSGIAPANDGFNFMKAAFSAALKDMPNPVMAWTDYENMAYKQQKMKSNRIIG